MILVSGGFDPVHSGHLAMFRDATRYGGVLIALNSDDWLIRKKGFFFQSWGSRCELLALLPWIDNVIRVNDSDGTVVDALRRYRPKFFGNGGDRTSENTPELQTCRDLGIEPIFGLGGGKANSSSHLVARQRVPRAWGYYDLVAEGLHYKIKRLHVYPGRATSMQRHAHRDEIWLMPDGERREVKRGEWHQLSNGSAWPLEVLEVQVGDCREEDIEREGPETVGA